MMQAIGFYLLGGLAVVAGLFLVLSRNLLHSVLALAVASMAIAGLMLTLSAEFLAFVLVLVYVGAVVVIAVFAVMLTGNVQRPALPGSNELKSMAAVTVSALVVMVTGVVLISLEPATRTLRDISVQELGRLMLTEYLLPFELVSVLLLAAMVGAIVIARGKED